LKKDIFFLNSQRDKASSFSFRIELATHEKEIDVISKARVSYLGMDLDQILAVKIESIISTILPHVAHVLRIITPSHENLIFQISSLFPPSTVKPKDTHFRDLSLDLALHHFTLRLYDDQHALSAQLESLILDFQRMRDKEKISFTTKNITFLLSSLASKNPILTIKDRPISFTFNARRTRTKNEWNSPQIEL